MNKARKASLPKAVKMIVPETVINVMAETNVSAIEATLMETATPQVKFATGGATTISIDNAAYEAASAQ